MPPVDVSPRRRSAATNLTNRAKRPRHCDAPRTPDRPLRCEPSDNVQLPTPGDSRASADDPTSALQPPKSRQHRAAVPSAPPTPSPSPLVIPSRALLLSLPCHPFPSTSSESIDFQNRCQQTLDATEALRHRFMINAADSYPVVKLNSPPKGSAMVNVGIAKRSRARVVFGAKIDGLRYVKGDFVAIANEPEESCAWFGRVEYFWEEENDKTWVHLTWFERHAFTMEYNSARELFYKGECGDHLASMVMGKVDVALHRTREETTGYFCRFFYDMQLLTFQDLHLPPSEDLPRCKASGLTPCSTCEGLLAERDREFARFLPSGDDSTSFEFQSTTYHIGDTVSVFFNADCATEIGIIVGHVETGALHLESQVMVRWFHRLDDLTAADQDDRKLVLTDLVLPVKIYFLVGLAEVIHEDELRGMSMEERYTYNTEGGKFNVASTLESCIPSMSNIKYADDLRSLAHRRYTFAPLPSATLNALLCRPCLRARAARRRFSSTAPKLSTVDLYAGVGGLSEGFKLAGVTGKTVAIESSRLTAEVHSINHPCATVIVGEVAEVIERLTATSDSRSAIDLVVGSPPCQPHSKANRGARTNEVQDPRKLEIIRYFDTIKLLQPLYFVFENVPGCMESTIVTEAMEAEDLMETQAKENIMRMALALAMDAGYQVQLGVLHAAHHGVPQARLRIFIIGTRTGFPMALLPPASHASVRTPGRHLSAQLESLETAPMKRWVSVASGRDGCAPHRGPRIDSALQDLPPFEYKEGFWPGLKDKLERRQHPAYSVTDPQEKVLIEGMAATFLEKARSSYARWCRTPRTSEDRDLRLLDTHLTSHVCADVTQLTATRVCNISPGGNHASLPEELSVNTGKGVGDASEHRFERLMGERLFGTIICTVNASGGGSGTLLHPEQHRLVSVREVARAQGFNDNYTFADRLDGRPVSPAEQYKLIGNAVPVPLAFNIARSIADAIWAAYTAGHNLAGTPSIPEDLALVPGLDLIVPTQPLV